MPLSMSMLEITDCGPPMPIFTHILFPFLFKSQKEEELRAEIWLDGFSSVPVHENVYTWIQTNVQDSAYNLDPERPEDLDDFARVMLAKEGKSLSDLETEIVEAPFVQVGSVTEVSTVCSYKTNVKES